MVLFSHRLEHECFTARFIIYFWTLESPQKTSTQTNITRALPSDFI